MFFLPFLGTCCPSASSYSSEPGSERERHVERQARDWLNHRVLRSKDEQSEIARVSKLNRWCTPVIHYMNRQHAASQADRKSSFRDAGYEELQLKRETEERPRLRSLPCQLCSSVTCGSLTCQVYAHYLILEEHEVMKTSNDRWILNTNQPVTLTWRRSRSRILWFSRKSLQDSNPISLWHNNKFTSRALLCYWNA